MGRGEEFTRRKQNKSARKRMRAEGGDLNPEESAAAKRRRRKGARRITEVSKIHAQHIPRVYC